MLKSMNTKIIKRRLIGLAFIICHLAFSVALTSCNDEWKDEQYEKYISFKAPLDDNGVTAVYVPYSRHNDDGSLMFGSEGKSSYDLPVIVAGTTRTGRDINELNEKFRMISRSSSIRKKAVSKSRFVTASSFVVSSALSAYLSSFFSNCSIRYVVSLFDTSTPDMLPNSVPKSEINATVIVGSVMPLLPSNQCI